MRFWFCVFAAFLCFTGCTPSPIENVPAKQETVATIPLAQHETEVKALRSQLELLERKLQSVDLQAKQISSEKQALEQERIKLIAETNRMTEARDSAVKMLAEIDARMANSKDEYNRAAVRFARLGDIEKDVAVRAFAKMKREGPGSVDKSERNLVEEIGTPEALLLVNQWDIAEAKRFGFDPTTGAVAPISQTSIQPKSKPKSSADELSKQLAAKRKTMKEVQKKGLEIKRQLSKMEGNETPVGLKKIAELEKQFDELQSEYNTLESDSEAIVRELKGEKPNDGYGGTP